MHLVKLRLKCDGTRLKCDGTRLKYDGTRLKCDGTRLKCDGTRAETSFRLSGETDESIWIGGGSQFSRLMAAELCVSAFVMLDTPRSEVLWRVLATHSIRQFPLHFSSRASPCAITFQTQSTLENKWSFIAMRDALQEANYNRTCNVRIT